VAKRRLSRRLRELRAQTQFTADRVCSRLSWGRGKVGRIEANAWKRPEMSDIRDLLHFYGVDDDERRELELLATLARDRAWWRDYGDVFGETEFPGFESDAARISCYMPLILPGLLQTAAYTEAHTSIAMHPPRWRERAGQVRQRRQQILDRTDGTAPGLLAVFTEAPLLYSWGSLEQRRAQLAHLLDAGRRPNVEIRLLRFEDGLHPGMCGPINIFEFPGDEPTAVFLETDFAIHEVSTQDEVNAYDETFGRICRAALDAPATAAHLTKLLRKAE
jgi:transcriptional regulator with XRE-family HTH domain